MFHSKKIKIYHHVFLNSDKTWIFILLDQLKYLEDSKLLNYVDEYNVNVVGDKNQLYLLENIFSNYKNIKIFFSENSSSEVSTLKKLWLDSQNEDFYALYIHLKGVTSFENHFKKDEIDIFRNIYYWRKFCEWAVIEKWKLCILLLSQEKDIVGCNLNQEDKQSENSVPTHFSGNIWWANSSYIRTLDDIENSEWWRKNKKVDFVDRLIAELWPCSKTENAFSISDPPKTLQFPNKGLYSKSWLREYYE